MAKILVVDDERPISDIIKFNLVKDGYEVVTAADGSEALDIFEKEKPDLVLLDQMLPEVEGTEVLRRIRINSNIPVIMVTAKGSEIDRVLGLEMGADDYVTKPFSNRELMARVKANLRYIDDKKDSQSNNSENNDVQIGELTIKPNSYTVLRHDEIIDLTHREFDLLYYLAMHPGQIMDRESLLQEVWGFDYFGDVRTVDVTVRRLREKIEEQPNEPQYLLTKRGVGYLLRNNK